MNYIIHKEQSIPFVSIATYIFSKNIISMELILETEEQVYDLYLYLRENLNTDISIQKDNISINFILTECYINKNIIILKGRN